jgi:hypothetical protein
MSGFAGKSLVARSDTRRAGRDKDHSLEVLSVVHQLVDLNKSATDLRLTPTVQVVPYSEPPQSSRYPPACWPCVSHTHTAAGPGRQAGEGQRISGVYMRPVELTSGRYALLQDGKAFSLVPWKPMLEGRVGQRLSVTVLDGRVDWTLSRQRGVGS